MSSIRRPSLHETLHPNSSRKRPRSQTDELPILEEWNSEDDTSSDDESESDFSLHDDDEDDDDDGFS